MWIVFWVVVSAALLVDLVVISKLRGGDIHMKEAVIMVCIWVSLALFFGVAVYFTLGQQKALEYFTAYIVEYSLSVDNMFVFLMIFAYFAVPKNHQPKVLMFGIIGAVVFRFLFIFVGVQLINAISWIIYVFGAILIITAIRMVVKKEGEMDPSKNIAYRLLKKIFPFKHDHSTNKFFIRENGVLHATPMLAAVVVVEMSDIMFAVDSIPAVLAISRDTFIVYSSNVFAIIGLRSLFFLLSNLASKFKFLQYGVAVILMFVGVKMLISHYYHFPTAVSLSVIVGILAISVIISIIQSKMQKEKEE